MKNLFLIACVIIWSCSNQTDKNSNLADTTAVINNQTIATNTDNSKSHDNFNLTDTLSTINNVTSIDSTPIQINTTFPFGCANLTKLEYPKVWEGEGDGTLKQPHGKEFDKIYECFQKVNSAKTIKRPETHWRKSSSVRNSQGRLGPSPTFADEQRNYIFRKLNQL